MKIKFKHRWSSKIAFEVEIGEQFKNESLRMQRREAIKQAIKDGSNLSGSDLSGSNLSGSNLSGSDLSGSNLSGSDLSGVPEIIDIHKAVYTAATATPNSLNMGDWHSCETTHCRAGWVVHLAGPGGAALEWAIGTPAAAALIYLKSDPKIGKMPNFYASNEEALAEMKRLAKA